LRAQLDEITRQRTEETEERKRAEELEKQVCCAADKTSVRCPGDTR